MNIVKTAWTHLTPVVVLKLQRVTIADHLFEGRVGDSRVIIFFLITNSVRSSQKNVIITLGISSWKTENPTEYKGRWLQQMLLSAGVGVIFLKT